jgi:hypothetical protein
MGDNVYNTDFKLKLLDDDEKQEMINSPWDTKSDTFYFVGDKLVMHHKAIYNYSPAD